MGGDMNIALLQYAPPPSPVTLKDHHVEQSDPELQNPTASAAQFALTLFVLVIGLLLKSVKELLRHPL